MTSKRYLISKQVKFRILIAGFFLLTGLLSSCSLGNSEEALKMYPASELPAQIQNAPDIVRESYQFALANPEILKHVGCYCGCDAVGHESNYACYANETDSSGVINYDNHALGCSICVDITQDVMRMHEEGKSIEEIQVSIDQIYSKYGPSNLPANQ